MMNPVVQPSLRDRVVGILSPAAKVRLASALCHPFVGRAIASISGDRIRSGDLTIQTENPSIDPRTKAKIFWGIYERAEIRFVRRYLRADLDVLEVGSSLGVVSCHAASRLDADARMVCVEANPALVPTIQGNLALNCPHREVRVLNRALDYESRSGTTKLRLTGDTSESRLGRLASEVQQAVREVEVPTATIASVVLEAGLRAFTLISDVEGAEAGFILGDPRELEGCRMMIIELHDTEHAGRQLRW